MKKQLKYAILPALLLFGCTNYKDGYSDTEFVDVYKHIDTQNLKDKILRVDFIITFYEARKERHYNALPDAFGFGADYQICDSLHKLTCSRYIFFFMVKNDNTVEIMPIPGDNYANSDTEIIDSKIEFADAVSSTASVKPNTSGGIILKLSVGSKEGTYNQKDRESSINRNKKVRTTNRIASVFSTIFFDGRNGLRLHNTSYDIYVSHAFSNRFGKDRNRYYATIEIEEGKSMYRN